MDFLIQWFKSTDWIANALAILGTLATVATWLWRRTRTKLARPRSFSALVRARLSLPYPTTKLQSIAQVAIVDDNLSDFPITDLRRAGFHIKTYKYVSVADFDELSTFDVVFLDMRDIVRDDPTEGGLKLIRNLRQKNSRQKICAVSGNQFNPSATAFFKLADDALNKPVSAQRCADVLEAFLREKLDPEGLARSLDEPDAMPQGNRKAALEALAHAASQRRVLPDSNIPAGLPPESRTAVADLSRVLAS